MPQAAENYNPSPRVRGAIAYGPNLPRPQAGGDKEHNKQPGTDRKLPPPDRGNPIPESQQECEGARAKTETGSSTNLPCDMRQEARSNGQRDEQQPTNR